MNLPEMKRRNCPKVIISTKGEGAVVIQEGHVFEEVSGRYLGEAPAKYWELSAGKLRLAGIMPPQESEEGEEDDEGHDFNEVGEEEVVVREPTPKYRGMSLESLAQPDLPSKQKRGRPKKVAPEVADVPSVEPGR